MPTLFPLCRMTYPHSVGHHSTGSCFTLPCKVNEKMSLFLLLLLNFKRTGVFTTLHPQPPLQTLPSDPGSGGTDRENTGIKSASPPYQWSLICQEHSQSHGASIILNVDIVMVLCTAQKASLIELRMHYTHAAHAKPGIITR